MNLLPKNEPPKKETDWSGLDDNILIKAFLTGEKAAFEVLFRKYRDLVGRLAFSIVKEKAAVDDVVQDVFLLVYRHLAKFKFNAAFKTWIYRITVNEALRHSSRERRWQALPEGDAEPSRLSSTLVVLENGETPERFLIGGQQRTLVHEALDKLKSNHRIILVLFYLEDQSVQVIAEILRIPEGSVKSRLFYARESLRNVLDPIFEKHESNETERVHVL